MAVSIKQYISLWLSFFSKLHDYLHSDIIKVMEIIQYHEIVWDTVKHNALVAMFSIFGPLYSVMDIIHDIYMAVTHSFIK